MSAEIDKVVTLSIPFASPEIATLASEVLSVDKEIRRSTVTKEIITEGENLLVNFSCTDLRKLRVSVNGFMKNVILIIKTLDQFSDK